MSLLHHYVHSNVLFIFTVAYIERNYYCQTFEDEAFLSSKAGLEYLSLKYPVFYPFSGQHEIKAFPLLKATNICQQLFGQKNSRAVF